jgi:hypothetical protein
MDANYSRALHMNLSILLVLTRETVFQVGGSQDPNYYKDQRQLPDRGWDFHKVIFCKKIECTYIPRCGHRCVFLHNNSTNN